MKPVRFTRRAMDKLEVLRQWGFTMDRERIAADSADHGESSPGHLGRSIARLRLDGDHVLRVVYEENGEVVVITMYPGRRHRVK